jgi:hypothetical protein
MNYFVRIITDQIPENHKLDESIFPTQQLYESEQGAKILEIPLDRPLSVAEADGYAERLSAVLFEQGYEDFDIEISTEGAIMDEETLDGDDFFQEYGVMWYNDDQLDEADYQGKKVTLGKPVRSSGGPKKFHVYVRDPKTKNIKKVNFGDPNMSIKKSNPARRRSFRARHNCDNPGPRTKARYWSCRAW